MSILISIYICTYMYILIIIYIRLYIYIVILVISRFNPQWLVLISWNLILRNHSHENLLAPWNG